MAMLAESAPGRDDAMVQDLDPLPGDEPPSPGADPVAAVERFDVGELVVVDHVVLQVLARHGELGTGRDLGARPAGGL